MPTTLVQETGTGVANGNTFALVSDLVLYHTARGNTDIANATQALQEVALILAGDYLRNESRFYYKGSKGNLNQRMPFPRTGATYRRGQPIPSNAIPNELLDAQCELALRVYRGTDVQPDLTRGGRVESRSVMGITTKWAANAPKETEIQAVMGIMEPLLITLGTDNSLPVFAVPINNDPFTPGEFDNAGIATNPRES